MRRLASLIMVLAFIAPAGGCAWLPYKPSENEKTVLAALDPQAPEGVAILDFPQLIPGEWTRMIIVCTDVKASELQETLGFDWHDGPNVESDAFGNMFVFATEWGVVSTLGPEFDEDGDGPVISACTHPGLGGREVTLPIEVDRAHSVLTFTLNTTFFGRPVWYPSREESDRLRELTAAQIHVDG